MSAITKELTGISKEFEKFALEIREAMQSRYPEKRVELRQVTKNNGVLYTGIAIAAEDEHIFPTMYLEPFYDETEGCITDDLIDRMCKIYESRRLGDSVEFEHIRQYQNIRERLRARLINYESNKDRLEEIPHKRFMDLAIVPYCIVTELQKRIVGEATFVVTKANVSMWDVSADQVIEDAISNTLNEESVSIIGMYEMLKRLNPAFAVENESEIQACPMYIMTTEKGNYGAISMIQEDKIREFCESIGKDVYIIPSSVHESILIPYDEDTTEETINNMINEVNQTQLDAVDVLSNHVYYFNRTSGYKMNEATA